jgi:hypothetical protein
MNGGGVSACFPPPREYISYIICLLKWIRVLTLKPSLDMCTISCIGHSSVLVNYMHVMPTSTRLTLTLPTCTASQLERSAQGNGEPVEWAASGPLICFQACMRSRNVLSCMHACARETCTQSSMSSKNAVNMHQL